MANYLTSFNTLDDYKNATNLDLPNVSLILSNGDVFYKNLFAGASLGDVLMWDVENQKLVTTYDAAWDATTYPIDKFEPIAINIYPANKASDGKARFMALRWASNTSDTGSASIISLRWGLEGYNFSTDTAALNGREMTDYALSLADGTTANTQSAFAAFAAVNRFRTNGTNAGDWYLPSRGELSLYGENYNFINEQISKIKAASSSIVSTVSHDLWSSSVGSSNNAWCLTNFGSWDTNDRSNGTNSVRGVISL